MGEGRGEMQGAVIVLVYVGLLYSSSQPEPASSNPLQHGLASSVSLCMSLDCVGIRPCLAITSSLIKLRSITVRVVIATACQLQAS